MDERGSGYGQPGTGNDLRRGGDIAARLLEFGGGVVGVARRLTRDVAGRHVASQLVRAGTSAGANYEEARAAESRADFVHKVRIAAKEMREAGFWLRLVRRTGLAPVEGEPSFQALLDEASALAAVLGASARTATKNSA